MEQLPHPQPASPDNVPIVHVAGAFWYPVYTKPRCEKVVEEYCQVHSIPCYLPLLRRAKRYQRRTVETFLPMFRGYVFAQLDDALRSVFLQSHKVVHILPITESQEELLISELLDIQQLVCLQAITDLVVLPELMPGSPVVVSGGPLKGMHGVVERRKSRTRITVNVEMLGQSVTAELDVGELELDLPE